MRLRCSWLGSALIHEPLTAWLLAAATRSHARLNGRGETWDMQLSRPAWHLSAAGAAEEDGCKHPGPCRPHQVQVGACLCAAAHPRTPSLCHTASALTEHWKGLLHMPLLPHVSYLIASAPFAHTTGSHVHMYLYPSRLPAGGCGRPRPVGWTATLRPWRCCLPWASGPWSLYLPQRQAQAQSQGRRTCSLWWGQGQRWRRGLLRLSRLSAEFEAGTLFS